MFGTPQTHSSGLALVDAQWDFRHARRSYLVGRVGDWMRRCRACRHPRTLTVPAALAGGPRKLEAVPLGSIVGTIEPTDTFDASFRPASDDVRRRWERIAVAHRKGDALPPITLRRQPDGYYIVDGRHRVSVARALGLGDIDAWVTGPAPCPSSVRPAGGGA